MSPRATLRHDLSRLTDLLLSVVALHNNFAYQFSNGVGAVKLLTLVFIAITGLVVLGGHTKVPEPHANFENSFDGQATAYGLTNALYRIIFSYAGFENAFNVVNEVKVCSEMIGQFDTGLYISTER